MLKGRLSLRGTLRVRVVSKTTRMECRTNPSPACVVVLGQRANHVLCCLDYQNLRSWLKAIVDSRPIVAEQARPGAGHLKHPSRR